MNIAESLWAPMRRVGNRVLRREWGAKLTDLKGQESVAEERARARKRRTAPLPSIFDAGLTKSTPLPKRTPQNLRRFAEVPVARKAINTIKDRVAGMQWRIQPRRGRVLEELALGAERIRIATENFEQPNPDDSFRSFAEQVLEDIIVGGFGAVELQLTGDERRPLAMWPVDGATIRMKADWNGEPNTPRYVQETGLFGEQGHVVLNDEQLSYIRLNPRTHTPFGLGRLEVAFDTVHAFLGAHNYASRLASNSVVQYALWLQELDPVQHERLIRWWQDEIEGTGRVPILSAESKPEVIRFGGGTDADLRMQWQQFLIRVIAAAFDLPPMFLGVEGDVNRASAGELSAAAFQTAIVPTAKLLAEHLTRDALGKRLGWTDLEFVFTDVDAPNAREQAEIDQILLRNGIISVAEARRSRGLPPLEATPQSRSTTEQERAKESKIDDHQC